jgi:hypothetical protein
MDGGHAASFLESLQQEILNLRWTRHHP